MSSLLSRADVARIAALARLELNDAELELYARQLGDILAHAQQLLTVDTNGVPPYTSTMSADALRDDVPAASLSRDDALRNAPQGDRASGTFVVPKVIG